MNIEEIQTNMKKMLERINTLDCIIEDYNNCKSDISKKMLEAAINKYATPFTTQKTEE